MAEIIIQPLVELRLEQLIYKLYKNEYFGFLDSAIEYGRKIKAIMYDLPTLQHSRTRNSNMENGMLHTIPKTNELNIKLPLTSLGINTLLKI